MNVLDELTQNAELERAWRVHRDETHPGLAPTLMAAAAEAFVAGWHAGRDLQAGISRLAGMNVPRWAPPDGHCRGCGADMPAGLHPWPWCDLMKSATDGDT